MEMGLGTIIEFLGSGRCPSRFHDFHVRVSDSLEIPNKSMAYCHYAGLVAQRNA
jgi:hypothetical protein